jgi:arylsulfatase A-like enzyme
MCSHAVSSADLVATLCRTAEINVPWKLHGRDISTLLRDPQTTRWSSPMLLTHHGRFYGSETRVIPTGDKLTETNGVPWWVMLRDGRLKYIRTLQAGEMEEVYDLERDPDELQNLALDPARRPLLESLREKTLAELRRTEAGFVDSLPPTRAMQP